MTPEEELRFWDGYRTHYFLGERRGQALMNSLRQFPVLYDMITGTPADCFYQDERSTVFLETLGIPAWSVPVRVPGVNC